MKRKNTFSIIAMVLLLAVGIALRVFGMGSIEQESVYFDLAKVAEGQEIPPVAYGAAYAYIQLLHLMFRVFGNIFEAAIWLQIVLQMIAGSLVYSGVRKTAGTISAIIALGVLMLSPWSIKQALILSPECLLLLSFSLALFACGKCIEKKNRVLKCIGAVLLLAVTCYLYILEILNLSSWKFGDWLSMELMVLVVLVAGSCLKALFSRKKGAVESVWEDGKMEACLEAISTEEAEWEAVDESQEASVEEPVIVPQIKLIENPLPLPKKHVKKVLDYDRELEEGKDDFDIEIDECDDFDI